MRINMATASITNVCFMFTILLFCSHVYTLDINSEEPTSIFDGISMYFSKMIYCSKSDARCKSDIKGYSSISRLFSSMDTNRDGVVDEREAHANAASCHAQSGRADHAPSKPSVDDVNKNAESMSFDKMWQDWSNSEAYHWSTSDVIDWLYSEAGVTDYDDKMEKFKIKGNNIARFTENDESFLKYFLGINNKEHRLKIKCAAINFIMLSKSGSSIYMNFLYSLVFLLAMTITKWFFVQNRISKSLGILGKYNSIAKEHFIDQVRTGKSNSRVTGNVYIPQQRSAGDIRNTRSTTSRRKLTSH